MAALSASADTSLGCRSPRRSCSSAIQCAQRARRGWPGPFIRFSIRGGLLGSGAKSAGGNGILPNVQIHG